LQREQTKWKVDSNNRICDTSLGALGMHRISFSYFQFIVYGSLTIQNLTIPSFVICGITEAASEQQLFNSYGPIGQYASKKPKLSISKHLSDTSPEAATPATNATLSPGASQLSTMSNANKLTRQIASRDRGRKNKTVKVSFTPKFTHCTKGLSC
jgi:hypothetical protein